MLVHRQIASRFGQNLRLLALVAAAVIFSGALTGCNYVVLLGYLIGGPPSIEPDFDAQTGKSMTDKDVTVAVVCYAPKELQWDYDQIDDEVAKYVTYRLYEHQIQVINPDRVRDWLDRHPDWDRPEEIGEAFHATYVVYVDLNKFSLWEEGSSSLHRGRAEAFISVIEMDEEGGGEKIYSADLTSKFPLQAPRMSTEVTFATFKKQYLTRLSEEIGRKFYEYYSGDDIPDAI